MLIWAGAHSFYLSLQAGAWLLHLEGLFKSWTSSTVVGTTLTLRVMCSSVRMMSLDDLLNPFPTGSGSSRTEDGDSDVYSSSTEGPLGDPYPLTSQTLRGLADPSRLVCCDKSLSRARQASTAGYYLSIVARYDSLEDIQAACCRMSLVAGDSCKVWTLVDSLDVSRPWLAVLLYGLFEGEPSYDASLSFLRGTLQSYMPEVGIDFVEFVPWWDYHPWSARNNPLLSTSRWSCTLGDGLDVWKGPLPPRVGIPALGV